LCAPNALERTRTMTRERPGDCRAVRSRCDREMDP
jgi:hypothetical protein